jgi:phosphoribosylaminoimidazole carboxylase
MAISCIEDCYLAGLQYGYPYVLKKRKLAYDGNGNFVIHKQSDVAIGFDKLGGTELYAEKFIPFVKEIAVMVVRTLSNGVVTYPGKNGITVLLLFILRTKRIR